MFEVLLVLAVLAAVATLGSSVVLALRGRWHRARGRLARLGVGATLYAAVLAAVSLATPQRVLAKGELWCFDDWCVAVDEVTRALTVGPDVRATTAQGTYYIVTLRLENRARGRPQRAGSAAVRLLDAQGRIYEVSTTGQRAYEAAHGAAAPLTATLGVGERLATVRVFDVMAGATGLGLTVEHPVGPSPGWLVIGDQSSWLHARTIIRLE